MENGYTEYERSAYYYETDQMGIVHHSNYVRYFEEARLDMMKKCGMDYREMEKRGLIIPVLFVQTRYLKPLHFDEKAVIRTRLTKYDGIKMEFSYEIYSRETGQLCTTGQSGHCFLDKQMQPVRMKKSYPDLYALLKKLVEETA